MRKFLYLICFIISVFFGLSQNNALVLNGAYIRLNGGTAANPIFMVVNQPQTTGIIRPGGGHIHSESQYNHISWIASTTTGNYIFPFGVTGTAADYIPFEFNKTTAGNANITVSTFSTNSGNLPFAAPVSSMPQAASSIDRFWDIRSTSSVTANLTFRYRGIENTVATCATDTLKAQFWNNPAGPWSALFGPGNPGVTAGIGTVGSIPGQTYFQTTETVWALTTVPISPTISSSASITCNGSNNGSATVITSGGLGPYTFSWSPSTNTTNVATGLTPGTHTVTVTGANSCSQTKTISIAQPPAITLTANQTQVTCSALASATVNPSGGTPSYTAYTWSPVVSGTNTATGLSAGNYTATVTDNNGCQQSTTITITSNTATPVVAASSSGSLNCTTSTVQAIASTTTAPVTYTWAGSGIVSGANTASITVNTGGTFDYTVTNTSNGCSTTGSQVVSQNTVVPTTTASTTGNLTCSTTTVALNSTLAGMNYTWTAPAGGSVGSANTQTTTASGVGGTYSLMVVNPANGCVYNTTTSVTQNAAVPTTTASTTGNLTCSTTTVALNSTLAGMNYTWTAPAGGSVGSTNTQTTTASGVGGTYSLMVVNPANGCVYNTTTSVTQNTAVPTTTASTTGNLTCSTTTVSLNSTLAGMNYTWTAPAGGSVGSANTQTTTASGVAGTYSLTVVNPANGCVYNTTTSVSQNTVVPTLTVSPNQTITCTAPTVTLTGSATPSTATPVWTGGVSGGSGSYTATANAPNIYTLTVTNPANGCFSSATTQVDANTVIPSVATSVTNSLSCTTLTAQVIATTTASPVSYNWTGPAVIGGANTASATVSAGGQYTVVVTNTTTSCSNTVTVSATQNTVTPTTVASSTGTLTCVTSTVDLTSTLAGMDYTWTAPAGGSVTTSSTQATIASGAPGDYSLTVSDPSNGCTYTTTANVPQNITLPTGVSAGTNQTLTCGSASVTLSGSISTPTNALVDWGTGVCGTQTTVVTEACAAGVYTLTATDPSNGCVATSTVEVFPNAGAPTVTISSSALTIDCNNTTQSVTVTSTPSTDVIYNWNNTPASASTDSSMATFNNAGTYICTVTNTLSGCSTPVQVVVTTNTTVPVIAISNTQTLTCTTTTVAITLTTTPATGMTYTWSSASTYTGQGNDTIVANAPDGYTVTVTDAGNGCTNMATSTVLQNTVAPILSAGSNQTLTCSASSSVTLTGSVTSPTNALVDWGTGVCGTQTTVVTEACAAGIYTLTATDPSNGCVATSTVQVFPSAGAPTVTISSAALTIDCNNSTQSVTVTSTPAADVVYHWNNTPASASADSSMATFNNAGTYICTVTNTISSCSAPVQVVVTTNTTVPTVTASNTQTLTCAVQTATISAVTTPTTGLSYIWSGTLVSGQGTGSVVVNQQGIYSVTVTNTANGCVNTATSQVVSGANVLNATISTTSSNTMITCQNTSVNVLATVTPTTATYNYTWTPIGGSLSTATVTSAGIYTVSVLDPSTGCTTSQTIAITSNTNVPTATVTDATIACGAAAAGIGGPAITTATNASYSWSSSGTGTILGGSTSTPTVNASGAYVVTVTDNNNGCTNTATVNVSQASITAAFSANPLSGTAPLDVNFTNQSTGATSYSWNFGDVISVNNTSGAVNPAHTYDNIGTYIVVLTASNGSCTSTATISIEVLENSSIVVPNVFTPNGDSKNDLFKIASTGIEELNCDIYNRWGLKLYTIKNINDSWDGSGASDGTYFFIMTAKGYDGKEYKQEGFINLFR